jgi:hypothetical protein
VDELLSEPDPPADARVAARAHRSGGGHGRRGGSAMGPLPCFDSRAWLRAKDVHNGLPATALAMADLMLATRRGDSVRQPSARQT